MASKIWHIVFALNFVLGFNCVFSSKILFRNGRYKDIVVAVHPDTDVALCSSIIGNLTEIFKEAGSQLQIATNGLALFGSVNILLPMHWEAEKCSLSTSDITPAKLFHKYETADFKLSLNHPIAKSLPWTKQYQGCGHEAEAIFLPVRFLIDQKLSLYEKSKLLTSEWMKFRYGVFDEFGFYDDSLFPPCYLSGNKQYYTSCGATEFASNSTGSLDNCRALTLENLRFLQDQLSEKSICVNGSQNGMAPNKQNILCERRSVSEVLFSHQDFKSSTDSENEEDIIFPNNRIPRPGSLPQMNIIKHLRKTIPGYVFISEDSQNIREFGRLDSVKQSIAELLRLASDETEVALYRYNGLVKWVITERKINLASESNRVMFLRKVPSNSTVMPMFFGDSFARSLNPNETPLDEVFQNVIDVLNKYSNVKWHMILVTSLPPVNVREALEILSKSDYSLSIVTFDDSEDWLKFNGIGNTRKLISLPSARHSSLITDHFVELVGSEEEPRRFFHKVVDFHIKELEGTFTIQDLVPNARNFLLHFPIYDDETNIIIEPPSFGGQTCTASRLLGYSRILEVYNRRNECPYRKGEWKFRIVGHPSGTRINYKLRGYVETVSTAQDLIVTAAIGHNLDEKVFARTNQIPVYISVTTKNEEPVIYASVEVKTFSEGNQTTNSTFVVLKDNGIDPDITANDGVYSAFLTNFNSFPSYHTSRARIRTIPGLSKAIKSLRSDTFDAALLNSKLSSKCCGSKVAYKDVVDISYSFYTITLPSFRTGEMILPGKDFILPSRIHSPITIKSNTHGSTICEFLAPGSNNDFGQVSYYSICCTLSTSGKMENDSCHKIENEDCAPVEANKLQTCTISHSELITLFFNETSPEPGTNLYCGFKGVDDSGNFGRISSFLVDIPFTNESMSSQATGCDSIADGCIPFDWLYVLMASIGCLIIIVFAILMCWWCSAKSTKKRKIETERKSALFITRGVRKPVPTIRNVYINQAYIQDANGDLRLVASDGQLFSTSATAETEFVNESRISPGIRRRSISFHDMNNPAELPPPRESLLKYVPRNTNSTIVESETLEFHASLPSVRSSMKDETPLSPEYFLNTFSSSSNRNSKEVGDKTSPKSKRNENPLPVKLSKSNGKPIYASVQRSGVRRPLLPTIGTIPVRTSQQVSSPALFSSTNPEVVKDFISKQPKENRVSHMLPMLAVIPNTPETEAINLPGSNYSSECVIVDEGQKKSIPLKEEVEKNSRPQNSPPLPPKIEDIIVKPNNESDNDSDTW